MYKVTLNVIFIVAVCYLFGCSGTQKVDRSITYPDRYETLDHQSPFLKAHLRDGELVMFSKWSVDTVARAIKGDGQFYDLNRSLLDERSLQLSIDSVALFETNVVGQSGGVTSLAIMSAVSAAISVACLTNPKACFGSCPTFYVSNGSQQTLQAEGFSASILPSLEATDIDALYRASPNGRDVEVTMKNEAYETHVVRYVNLLTVPCQAAKRVFVTSVGSFWTSSHLLEVSKAIAPEGNCLDALSAFDGVERFSTTDSSDLAAREQLILSFHNVPKGKIGLVLAMRQTLLSTYLFYQTLGYLGKSAGEYLARCERGDLHFGQQVHNLGNLVGEVNVYVKGNNGSLQFIEEVAETGPLATDTHLILLPLESGDEVTLVLDMVRGAWRLDWAGLAVLDGEVTPDRILPATVIHNNIIDDKARQYLLDSSKVLTAFPGDEYTMVFRLPDDRKYELFLESRGYYLEWMREEWYKEENLVRAGMLFFAPQQALKIMAPEFKRVESTMETLFWNSKYVRH